MNERMRPVHDGCNLLQERDQRVPAKDVCHFVNQHIPKLVWCQRCGERAGQHDSPAEDADGNRPGNVPRSVDIRKLEKPERLTNLAEHSLVVVSVEHLKRTTQAAGTAQASKSRTEPIATPRAHNNTRPPSATCRMSVATPRCAAVAGDLGNAGSRSMAMASIAGDDAGMRLDEVDWFLGRFCRARQVLRVRRLQPPTLDLPKHPVADPRQ